MTTPGPGANRRSTVVVLAATLGLMLSVLPLGAVSAAVPASPTTPDLASTSDTGNSNTDNITRTLNGLVFTGTAEAGSTVKIYVGASTEIGRSVASAGGAYSVTTIVAIPDNATNLVTATATNGDGPSRASPPLTVTTDNRVPGAPSKPNLDAASDTGTSSTDNITSDTTPSFSGTSAANATVELRAAGVAVGTVVATGTNWTITSSLLGAGSYTFTAVQTDAAGNGPSPVSSRLQVTIDTSVPPPPSAPDLVAASDTGPSSTDNITSDRTPTFSGRAVAGARVELFADSRSVGTDVVGGNGTWQITSRALSGGAYSFTATATNVAGTSVASPGLSVTIQALHYIVTASITTPVPGATVTITAQLADASNNAVPVAGIVVTWSSTGGGSFSATTSTTNASGIATVTFTVSPRTGVVHTVTATGGGFKGTSANITTAARAAQITLTTSASVITWAQPVVLAIHFATAGSPRPFALQVTRDLVSWQTVPMTLMTDSFGNASLSYRPATNLWYRVSYAGAADLSAAFSNVLRVVVRQIALLRPTSLGAVRTVSRNSSVTFTTTVRPVRSDLAPAKVTFVFYRLVNGTWTLSARRDVLINSAGLARTTWKFSTSGSWYVRSIANPMPVNANSVWSPVERYNVH